VYGGLLLCYMSASEFRYYRVYVGYSS